MRLLLCVSLFLGLAIGLPGNTVSADSEYNLDWHSIASGGETRSAGGDYELAGTIGQHGAGAASGGDFQVEGGFLAGAATTVKAFHPADVNKDGAVNAQDIQLVINEILGIATGLG